MRLSGALLTYRKETTILSVSTSRSSSSETPCRVRTTSVRNSVTPRTSCWTTVSDLMRHMYNCLGRVAMLSIAVRGENIVKNGMAGGGGSYRCR